VWVAYGWQLRKKGMEFYLVQFVKVASQTSECVLLISIIWLVRDLIVWLTLMELWFIVSESIQAGLYLLLLLLLGFNELENIQRKFANLCHNRFVQYSSLCNYEAVLNYLRFKSTFLLLFVLTLSRAKLTVVLLGILLVSV
jgi:hypothetical protein